MGLTTQDPYQMPKWVSTIWNVSTEFELVDCKFAGWSHYLLTDINSLSMGKEPEMWDSDIKFNISANAVNDVP